ncbi:hypothetical protein, partial [uncultured Bacteroides sp.]|uniref:hypothetical protein n=1 Tax=uncultured Bacteroides sp. TaxID=162156 RepID=UPI00262BC23B
MQNKTAAKIGIFILRKLSSNKKIRGLARLFHLQVLKGVRRSYLLLEQALKADSHTGGTRPERPPKQTG